eukprot:2015527-Amphidinium_carterae.1
MNWEQGRKELPPSNDLGQGAVSLGRDNRLRAVQINARDGQALHVAFLKLQAGKEASKQQISYVT